MLMPLLRLFDRYCARHLYLTQPGPAMPRAQGRTQPSVPEQISQITRRGNRLEVTGQVRAARITLICGDDQVSDPADAPPGPPPGPPPDQPPDQPQNPPPATLRRFLLDMPFADAPMTLILHRGAGAPLHLALPRLPRRAQRRARRALLAGFVAGLVRAAPLILRWGLLRDPALRPRIRAALGLWHPAPVRRLSAHLFARETGGPDTKDACPGQHPVTCILPVYNALDLLPEVLDRVLRHTDLPWHLVLIEDASPDPAVRPFVRHWAAARNAESPGRVTVLENDRNLGFIGSVNRGLDMARKRGLDMARKRDGPGIGGPQSLGPVILLNADAFVPEGWASRLIRPMLADKRIASTTPMSNDAELFSVPGICARVPLAPGQGDAIDRVAQGFTPGAGDAPAPTGVGFCMALSPDWLARVPLFDTAFGAGYGEDVDWSLKTSALGARHVGVANLFVEHRGGASFGSARKQRLIVGNGATVAARYPTYGTDVQDYLQADPMITPRLALAIAWAAAQGETRAAQGATDGRIPVYLAHMMGGGVEYYQRRRLTDDIARVGAAVVLRVGGPMRWRLEVHAAPGVTRGETDDFALIRRLLAPLTRRHILYSCAVGDPDPLTIPDRLLDLYRTGQDRLEVLFHDFFPLSPSFTLLGRDGQFAGVPMPASSDTASSDTAHSTRRPDGTPVDLAAWRHSWGRLIMQADRLVVFSHDSRAHVQSVWPDAAARLQVIAHRPHHAVPRVIPRQGPAPADERPVVGVLGNLNRQKGAAVVAETARLLARDPSGRGPTDPKRTSLKPADLTLVVMGDTDPACPPGPGVTVHGAYRLDDLPLLTHRYKISAWLIPSVWPETFSYTTHEALATGLPVFCLDLGAQAEALRRAPPQGHVITCPSDTAAQAQAVLAALRATLVAAPRK